MAVKAECERCDGTRWIRAGDASGFDAYERCECYLREQRDSSYARIGLPPRFQDKTFDNFSAGSPRTNRIAYNTLIRALKQAQNFATDFPAIEKRGLLLHGGTVGRMTHIAVGALRALAERGFSCLYCDYQDLVQTLQERRDPGESADRGRELGIRIREVDMLVLDSLGECRRTPWVLDTIGSVIKHRYAHDKGLIVTTGLPLDAPSIDETERFQEMRAYNPVQDTLADRIGTGSLSRLFEHCTPVLMAVPDADPQQDPAGRPYSPRGRSRS